jgi:hypothetical protein
MNIGISTAAPWLLLRAQAVHFANVTQEFVFVSSFSVPDVEGATSNVVGSQRSFAGC